MAKEFKEISPEQYDINIKYLESVDDDFLTGVSVLKAIYNSLD